MYNDHDLSHYSKELQYCFNLYSIEKVTLDVDNNYYPTNTFKNIIRGETNFKITVPANSSIGVDIVNNNLTGILTI